MLECNLWRTVIIPPSDSEYLSQLQEGSDIAVHGLQFYLEIFLRIVDVFKDRLVRLPVEAQENIYQETTDRLLALACDLHNCKYLTPDQKSDLRKLLAPLLLNLALWAEA